MEGIDIGSEHVTPTSPQTRVAPVPQAFDKLRDKIQVIGVELDLLEKALASVLSELVEELGKESRTPIDEAVPDPSPQLSSLAGGLNEQSMNIGIFICKIKNIRERLEI